MIIFNFCYSYIELGSFNLFIFFSSVPCTFFQMVSCTDIYIYLCQIIAVDTLPGDYFCFKIFISSIQMKDGTKILRIHKRSLLKLLVQVK